MTKRLYRSAGTNATYQLVAENISGTTYNDTLLDTQILGDELLSVGWNPPPVDLIAVDSLSNGCLVGLSGSLLCYSEPYQAHAWLPDYQFGLAHEGVGLVTYGTTTVVGTKGMPYIADGTDPTSVTVDDVKIIWPCLSKRSMVSIGDGALFATTHGMAYVGNNGPAIWSQEYFTREDWSALDPTSMVSAAAEGKVFVKYKALTANETAILVFIPSEPVAALTTLSLNASEIYADPRNGHLYVVDTAAANQYDAASGDRIPYDWWSKEIELPEPVNMGAARVEFVQETTPADVAAIAAAYSAAVAAQLPKISNGIGAVNGGSSSNDVGFVTGYGVNGYVPQLPTAPGTIANVTFSLYSKGTLVFSRTMYSNEAFRLPSGYKTDALSVRLNGAVRVKNVKIAETPDGLRKL